MISSTNNLEEIRTNYFSESLACLQREACRLGYHEAAHFLAVARESITFPRTDRERPAKPASAKSQEG